MRLWIFIVCFIQTVPPFLRALPMDDLHEGGPCMMEDGGPGICRKVIDCPFRLQEIRDGKRGPDSGGRCGFDGQMEIACCPHNVRTVTRIADLACEEFVNRTDEGSLLTPHVAGGQEARQEEFPYVAALGYKSEEKIEYTCVGTLISERHVLTAAHCVHNEAKRVPVEVRLGDVNLRYLTKDTRRIPIKRITWHHEYSKHYYYNDVAVITMERNVSFTSSIRPICLPTEATRDSIGITDSSLIVVGWGRYELNSPLSDDLMKSPGLSLIHWRICDQMYQNSAGLPRGLDWRMICAIDRNSSRRADACPGDSGGPFIQRTSAGDTIIGITSFGQGCGGTVPGVYTSVYPYLSWIEDQVWGNADAIDPRIQPYSTTIVSSSEERTTEEDSKKNEDKSESKETEEKVTEVEEQGTDRKETGTEEKEEGTEEHENKSTNIKNITVITDRSDARFLFRFEMN